MDMITSAGIDAAGLTDWRRLSQGLHTRYVVADLGAGARLVTATADAADDVSRHLRVTMGERHVDLVLVSDDAVYRDDQGVEHRVEWVTRRDLELARLVSDIAQTQGAVADPAAVTVLEPGLDTHQASTVGPFWAALLTGSTEAHGRGTVGDDVRDATHRVPVLWFQDTDEHPTPRQRFHFDVWVAPEAADERIAAAVAAGGVVVDDSEAPSFTVLADADGNRACVCTSQSRD